MMTHGQLVFSKCNIFFFKLTKNDSQLDNAEIWNNKKVLKDF